MNSPLQLDFYTTVHFRHSTPMAHSDTFPYRTRLLYPPIVYVVQQQEQRRIVWTIQDSPSPGLYPVWAGSKLECFHAQ